jgi:hypothetical protein
MAETPKRILVMSDTHCGHKVGLTPPEWWLAAPSSNPRQQKVSEIQKQMWQWFAKTVDKYKPYTHLFHLGDAIDGKGERSGGTEQKTMDRAEQADMAAECINYAESPVVVLIAGTAYHVGVDEDWEIEVVQRLKAKKTHFEGHAFPVVNGVQFDLKHFITGSSVPYGGYTALARDKAWNIMWHYRDEMQPDSKILIRGHIHVYRAAEDDMGEIVSCPALQGFGSKYGARKCSGVVNIGLLVYDIASNGTWRRTRELAKLPFQTVQPLKL